MSARDFDTALGSLERDSSLLDLIGKLNRLDDQRQAEIKQLHAEVAELRDDMVALSNRIEAVTRASMPRGRGDTIAVVPEPLGDGTPCPRCGIYVHRPAHSCHVSRSNYVVA